MPLVGDGASDGWCVGRPGVLRSELSGGFGLTSRSADAATPRANVGGFSAKNHSPTMLVGRRRRAADAIVRQLVPFVKHAFVEDGIMRRTVGYALLLIAVFTISVLGINRFIQPLLPPKFNDWLVLLVAILLGVMGGIAAFKDTIELLNLFSGTSNRQGAQEEQESDSFSHVSGNIVRFGDNADVSGYVAAGDLVINADVIEDRVDELVEILEHRASLIMEELSRHFKYVRVRKYASRFQELHQQHIRALRKRNLIYAHEILRQIHELSMKMEADEFWTRHHIETPDVLYKLREDAFQRGIIITGYIAGDLSRYSPSYPEVMFLSEWQLKNRGLKSQPFSAAPYLKILSTAA